MHKPAWYPERDWLNVIKDDSFISLSRTLVGKPVTYMGREAVCEPKGPLSHLSHERPMGRITVYETIPETNVLPPKTDIKELAARTSF